MSGSITHGDANCPRGGTVGIDSGVGYSMFTML
jgi:hypothetical protein